MKLKITLPCLAFLLFNAFPSIAQLRDINFKHLGVEERIRFVLNIHQDANGFIWVSNYKYDGLKFKGYFPSADVIYHVKIGDLLADSWGREPDSLFYYDPKRDSFIRNDPERISFLKVEQNHSFARSNCNHCFFQDAAKNIWFGSATEGIFIYQPATKSFQNIRRQEGNEVGLSSNKISSILKDRTGRVWIGTWDAGINLLVKDSTFRHFRFEMDNPNSLPADTVTVIKEDQQGVIWIGTTAGLCRLDPKMNTISRIPFPDPVYKRVKKIFIDSAGKLWIASQLSNEDKDFDNQSIVLYDPATDKIKNYFNHLEVYWNYSIFSIVEDHTGRIWLGGDDGIYIYDPKTEKLSHLLRDPRDPASLSSFTICATFWILFTPLRNPKKFAFISFPTSKNFRWISIRIE